MSNQSIRLSHIAVAALILAAFSLAIVAPHAAAKAPKHAPAPVATGTIYGGQTSQHDPFVLKLSADRTQVAGLVLQVDTTCGDGTGVSYYGPATFADKKPTASDVRPGSSLFAPRVLSRTGSLTAAGIGAKFDGDVIDVLAAKLTIHVHGNRASGSLTAIVLEASPQTGDIKTSCHAVTTWQATSTPGQIFGGQTSQGFPVVVQASAAGDMVDALRFGWAATCSDSSTIGFGDALSGLPLQSNGAFNSTIPLDTQDSGTTVHAQYVVQGQLSHTSASGSIDVSATLTDSTGAARTCDTMPRHWTARTSAPLAKATTKKP